MIPDPVPLAVVCHRFSAIGPVNLHLVAESDYNFFNKKPYTDLE